MEQTEESTLAQVMQEWHEFWQNQLVNLEEKNGKDKLRKENNSIC
jgi:hypothetical protein